MLGSLTFAYCGGLLSSDEISAASKGDHAIRFLGGGQAPFAAEVTSCRRSHRVRPERLLARVLACVLTPRLDQVPPGIDGRILQAARERLDVARDLDETASD